MRKKKRNLIFIIVLIACAIGLGYAYLNSDLALNGYAGVSGNTWDVHWANLSFTKSSGVTCSQNPQIDPNDNTRIVYTCSLNVPNDYVEITVDAVNGGTIDAMVDAPSTIVRINNVDFAELPDYYRFDWDNDNGTELEEFQGLPANSTQTYIITIAFDPDAELLDANQSITLELGMNFAQADERAVPKPTIHDVFVHNNYNEDNIAFVIGQPLPEFPVYDSYQSVASEDGDIFLKHTMAGSIIKSTSVGILIDNTPYYICAEPSEIDPYTGEMAISPCYETNKSILQDAETQYGLTCNEDEDDFSCRNASTLDDATLIITTTIDGTVLIISNDDTCIVNNNPQIQILEYGSSTCGQ